MLATPLLAVAIFGLLRVQSVARADILASEDTIRSLDQATAILPGNAQFHARLAEIDPSRSSELDRAIGLNPRNASWWILRSVQQEESGDVAGAEASLRSAVAVARYYIPLWSLTAFYYRQGNAAGFILAAKDTLSVGTGDAASVFQMAGKLGLPSEIVESQILPERAEIVTSYLNFALQKPDWPSATRAALRLSTVGSKAETPSVMSACERLFLAGRIDDSVTVWNATVSAHWISMTPLSPATGISINEEAFSQPRIYSGFDWKVPAPAEVAVAFSPGRYAKLQFTGEQAEQCGLLSQYLPLLPARRYKLTTRYRTEDLPSASGLRWTVESLAPKGSALATSANLYSEDVTESAFVFETHPATAPVELFLSYARQPGTTRIKGNLWLQSVRLELLDKHP